MAATDANFLGGVLNGTAYEPIRNNNAILRFTELPAPLTAAVSNAVEQLKLTLAGFSLPKTETNPIMVPYLNEVRKFAGTTMFDDFSVSFHDYVDARTAKLLWTWRSIVHDPKTGLRGLKAQYAAQGVIEHFAPDGGRLRTYRMLNVWPMSLDMGEAEMGADEAMRVQVRFSCDKCYPDDQGQEVAVTHTLSKGGSDQLANP